MYTPKVQVHYNIEIVKGRYLHIKNPYRDPHLTNPIPGRWQKKQLQVNRCPENAGGGYFSKLTMPGAGKDPYIESVPYNKSFPPDSRKLGFGTKDAPKRDEFSSTIRTEQYRESLRREYKNTDPKGIMKQKLAKARQAWGEDSQGKENAAPTRRSKNFVKGREECEFLYDIGRKLETKYDEKAKSDTFYPRNHGLDNEIRLGLGYRPLSREIGVGVWDVDFEKPQHPKNQCHKTFYDKSHLNVGQPL